ncbi:tetratricopeptide repeat protein [Catalinimonas alkaloidigena]|nr:tetratricopeptide repeat protein [Catalinimonas alkaloidigena]
MAIAQNSAVTNAIFYQNDGLLDKAKEKIDQAAAHPKSMEKAKTWVTRGNIYADLMVNPLENYKQLGGDSAGLVAYDSYRKAIELDKEGGSYAQQAEEGLQNLWGNLLNQAFEFYNNKDYATALNMSQKAMEIKPEDTTAVIYAAAFAETKEDFDLAESYYNKLLEMDYNKPDVYQRLLYYAQQRDDNDKALEYVQQARAQYPDDKNFMLEELNLYFKTGRTAEARTKLEDAIKADPSNSALHFNLAALYDQEASAEGTSDDKKKELREKAISSYKSALESDPSNYDAAFNLGAVYYNSAAEILKKTNEMDLATYRKEGKKYEDQAKEYFKMAVEPFEKAYALKSDDPSLLGSMRTVYAQLGMKEKADKMDAEFQKLSQ